MDSVLLGYDAATLHNQTLTFQGTQCLHLQQSIGSTGKPCSKTCLPLMKRALHSFKISGFDYPVMQHHILESRILSYITAKTSKFTILYHDNHHGHAPRHNGVFVSIHLPYIPPPKTLNIFGFNLIWESHIEQANSILAHICSR
jgi:hypothetical protein